MTIRITKPELNLREKLKTIEHFKVPYDKMPGGTIVQVVKISSSTDTSVTGAGASSSWNSIVSTIATIYPKFSDSHLLYVCALNAEHDASSTSNIYGFLKLFKNINDGQGYQGIDDSISFFTESIDEYGATTTSTMHYIDEDHGARPGGSVSYRVYYNKMNNTQTTHFNQPLTVTPEGTNTNSFSKGYIMEIVQ